MVAAMVRSLILLFPSLHCAVKPRTDIETALCHRRDDHNYNRSTPRTWQAPRYDFETRLENFQAHQLLLHNHIRYSRHQLGKDKRSTFVNALCAAQMV